MLSRVGYLCTEILDLESSALPGCVGHLRLFARWLKFATIQDATTLVAPQTLAQESSSINSSGGGGGSGSRRSRSSSGSSSSSSSEPQTGMHGAQA